MRAANGLSRHLPLVEGRDHHADASRASRNLSVLSHRDLTDRVVLLSRKPRSINPSARTRWICAYLMQFTVLVRATRFELKTGPERPRSATGLLAERYGAVLRCSTGAAFRNTRRTGVIRPFQPVTSTRYLRGIWWRLAERVGFEPTCRLPDKTLSRRPRYDHFGTSPCRTSGRRSFNYTVTRAAAP